MFRVCKVTYRKAAIEGRSKFQNAFHSKFFIVSHSCTKKVSFKIPRTLDSKLFDIQKKSRFVRFIEKGKLNRQQKKMQKSSSNQHKWLVLCSWIMHDHPYFTKIPPDSIWINNREYKTNPHSYQKKHKTINYKKFWLLLLIFFSAVRNFEGEC